MTVVQLNRKRGPTPEGINDYLKLLECPRKFVLDRERDSASAEAAVGTIFHAMAAHYHTGGDVRTLSFEPKPNAFNLIEAARLFDAYQAERKRSFFGEVLGVEIAVSGAKAEAAVGVSPYRGTIDLVCRLSPADCRRINDVEGLQLTPGVWVVDHKTTKSGGGYLVDRESYSHQYEAYQLAWNASCAVKDRAVGAICNAVISTKTPKLALIQIPAPDAVRTAALHEVFILGQLVAQHMWNRCNSTACFKYGACSHFVEGRCSRV